LETIDKYCRIDLYHAVAVVEVTGFCLFVFARQYSFWCSSVSEARLAGQNLLILAKRAVARLKVYSNLF
jgi:hypothetical protein